MVMERKDFDVEKLWRNPTPYMENRAKQFENRDWFAEHMDEIWQKYRGQVVAVWDKEIKAVGRTADEVWAALGDKYPREGVMVILVPEEEIFKVPYPSDMAFKAPAAY